MAALASFDTVTKRFGDRVAVDGLSFDVPEGAVVGLLGPNGAGKTTAIRVLLGLARPSEGGTTLLGVPPRSEHFPEVMKRVGTLVEGPALYGNATGRQNLEIQAASLGFKNARVGIDEVLALVGLSGRAGDRTKNYSLGMKQRLGLATAMLMRPRLVVLDEPTNGLDPAGIQEIRGLIKALPQQGTTVLVSSHLLGEVQLMCDHVVIINRGRTVAQGTLDEVLATARGAGRFEIAVEPDLVPRAVGALSAAGLEARTGPDGTLRVVAEGRRGGDLNRLLAEAGVYADELRLGGASLEDVFMELTGGETADAS